MSDVASDAKDDQCDAALAALLTDAVRAPGMLERLWRGIWSALMRLHARRRSDGGRLPPEYWFWPH